MNSLEIILTFWSIVSMSSITLGLYLNLKNYHKIADRLFYSGIFSAMLILIIIAIIVLIGEFI